MHYKFPTITNISDVLPHIDDNFRKVTKEGITYINYNSLVPSIFPPVESEDDIGAKIRRECRGIAFDAETGEIVSRPFHKFFNMGERSDAQFVEDLPHIVLEKLDGSMIRPVVHRGVLRLATKMGVTEVAMQAEAYLAGSEYQKDYMEFLWECLHNDVTPVFEFTAPDNRIVLHYNQPSLTLLTIRENVTGRYWPHATTVFHAACYNMPHVFHSILDGVKDKVGEEGVVIRYHNGHMLKVKSDWYVKVHRAKDLLSSNRRFLEAVVNGVMDDTIASLLPDDKDRVQKQLDEFNSKVLDQIRSFDAYYRTSKARFLTKKDFAVFSKDQSGNHLTYRNLTFKLWDGKFDNPTEAINAYITTGIQSNEKTNEVFRFLGYDV